MTSMKHLSKWFEQKNIYIYLIGTVTYNNVEQNILQATFCINLHKQKISIHFY